MAALHNEDTIKFAIYEYRNCMHMHAAYKHVAHACCINMLHMHVAHARIQCLKN